ncbi:hypothetical protein C4D60_Mb05t19260 [Musa balbisiana]|uniref:Uncharacterized protein n=1 Tax=Musa balbisiana TaxID=52838 RepID=A0A4S8JXA0_MUSBA|nr:hypothetical protein C4D60_Mb05t19260 [Musa balbisiana]
MAAEPKARHESIRRRRSSSHPRPIRSAAPTSTSTRQDGLAGGRVIMLDGDASSPSAAFEALRPFPDGMQVEGGVNADELS